MTQRVVVERIELIGRQETRHDLEQEMRRRVLEPMVVDQALGRGRLQRTEQGGDPRHAVPEILERCACALAPADGEPVGHRHRVHRPGARRAHSLHLDARLFEQPVEHAPGERAMGTTALERQIDVLHLGDRWPGPQGDRPGASFLRMRIHRRPPWTQGYRI
jgi:hypothetical protein